MSTAQRARLVVALGVLNLVLVTAAFAVGGLGGWSTPTGASPTPSAVTAARSPELTPSATPAAPALTASPTASLRSL
ncbi:MAG TPA: hypothetical protein VIV06_07980, partial [Candidatus Limnocylindrales bacterium]